MATREERMRQRLRGAVRHQVEDISFGLFAPEPEPEPEAEPQPQPQPQPGHDEQIAEAETTPKQTTPPTAKSSSGKRLRHQPDSRPNSAGSNAVSARRSPIRSDPYEITSEQEEQSAQDDGAEDEDDVLALLPTQPTERRSAGTRRSLGSSDIVEESPAHAPGSGRRRSINTQGMRSSSQRMQRMLRSMDDAQETGSSSPLARKSRRSDATAAGSILEQSPRATRLSKSVIPEDEDDVDELSPNATKTAPREEGLAEDIDDTEAARVLGRKRPRRSTARRSSPMLGSRDEAEGSARETSVVEGDVEEGPESLEEEGPPPKRQKGKPRSSPAKQKQPAKKQRAARQKKREKVTTARADDTSADEMGNDGAAVIPITVQRFKKPRQRQADDGSGEDVLAANIPFTNHKGVNVIDVLAQSSEEVIGACIEQLTEALQNAEDSSARKELRVKIKALEAFGEEVRTRLLTHTIMLDNLYSLRQRVREAEITRNKLRESILRHRKEQEQLHIRMDAERDVHDENRKLLASRIDMSSNLHSIQQAIEQGRREDGNLNPSEVLKANLAMLDVNVPDLAGKVCRTSEQGGLMQQVRRFNEFLERAAVELERRPRTSGSRLLA